MNADTVMRLRITGLGIVVAALFSTWVFGQKNDAVVPAAQPSASNAPAPAPAGARADAAPVKPQSAIVAASCAAAGAMAPERRRQRSPTDGEWQ